MSSSENDRNDSNTPITTITASTSTTKSLLTQEFNTIPVNNTSSTVSTHVAHNSAHSDSTFSILNTLNSNLTNLTCPSLPFVISGNTNINDCSMMGITPPSFIYHPIQIPTLSNDQVQQYFSGKRVKMDTENRHSESADKALVEELLSFKVSLKSSFDANIQKLTVLDHLVQTVNLKRNFHFDALRSSLDILKSSRSLLKDLIEEQVKATAALTFELKSTLIPEITEAIKTVPVSSKGELVDKLRKEEDSHLTDLTILSTRNKELQKDQRSLKEQYDRLQAEYNESLKVSAVEKEEAVQFVQQLAQILKSTDSQDKNMVLDKIEDLLKDNDLKYGLYDDLAAIKETIEDIKKQASDLSAVDESCTCIMSHVQEIINSIITLQGDGLVDGFESILHSRERFYNQTLNSLARRFEDLLHSQNQLAHQSLSVKMSIQGQLADSQENCARLRKHCQQLTVDLNSAASELDTKRLLIQRHDADLLDLRKTMEDRIRMLESELSIKNQETRDLSIKNQEIRGEMDEAMTRHRHDTTALERKISVLESKLSAMHSNHTIQAGHSNNNHMIHAHMDDPFSSLCGRDSLAGNEEVTTVPPTSNKPKPRSVNFVITFTGIRDAQKQKEYGGWINELGATVHVGPDFNDDITHVLAPRGYKSIRVLAASLTGKWIVNSDWLEACNRAQEFLPESAHGGYCNTSIRPFRFRTLWMSAAFTSTHKNHSTYPTSALRTLLEKLGKARWCETQGQADFLVVTEEEKAGKVIESYSKGVLLTLNTLLSMIPIE